MVLSVRTIQTSRSEEQSNSKDTKGVTPASLCQNTGYGIRQNTIKDWSNTTTTTIKASQSLLKGKTIIDDPEWKLTWTVKQPLLFKNGKRYIPNDLNLSKTVLWDLHDHKTARPQEFTQPTTSLSRLLVARTPSLCKEVCSRCPRMPTKQDRSATLEGTATTDL